MTVDLDATIKSGIRQFAGKFLSLKAMRIASGGNLTTKSAQAVVGWILFAVAVGIGSAVWAQKGDANEAARLNNVGVALMNQQLTEKALAKFDAAHAADAAAAIPVVNRGIALLYAQKIPEAEDALKQAQEIDPNNARAWYAMGLAHFESGNPQLAIDDMQHVVKIDPKNADTYYFLGTFYLALKDFDHAVEEFETALRLNPVHASANFGLARTLQRMGKSEQAHEHLERFQHLTQEKISSPLSAAYGEQGRYATVQDMFAPPVPVGSMIPVHFVAQTLPGAEGTTSTSGSLGGGACIVDIEAAGSRDLVVMGPGSHAIRAYKNLHNGEFEELSAQQTGLSAEGQGVACAVGDFDNDELPDLAIAMSDRVILFRNLGGGKFEDVTKKVGIQQLNRPAGLTFVDFDHDGDLDLFVTGSALSAGTTVGPSVLWRNNGNSTFTEWTGPMGLAGDKSTVSTTLSDINNDRAVDLVVTGAAASPVIYENAREGKFKQVALYSDAGMAATRGVYIFDFNKDGWMDVAVTHAGAPGVSLWKNKDGEHFERVALPLQDAKAAWGLTAIDVDNDGWIDLAVIAETANGPSLRVLRNRGAQGFEDVSAALGLDKVKLKNPRSVIAVDVDGDGAADLIVTEQDGPPVVLRNVGGNVNHSMRIALSGLADNKTAIGTKVEVFSDGQWQKFEVAGGAGYLSQGSGEILAGLGKADKADVVRMLWPTGVPQDEIDLAANKPLTIKELDRRGSSCPVLFAWDGKQYQFISDVIGAAVVGHWVSPTATNKADPDEWIKVDG